MPIKNNETLDPTIGLRMKKILPYIFLMSVFFSTNAFSASVEHQGTVSRIYPTQGGEIRFQIDQTSGCSPITASNHYYVIYPAYDEYYALLLAAAHSNTTLGIFLDNAACNDGTIYTSQIAFLFQDF